MKIDRLYVKHFKGIKEIEIFAKDVNEICGKNGSGKSSTLDAIVACLAGKRNIDPKPLRDGETKGEITVDMGDIVVTRKFAEGKAGTLTVKAGDKKMGQRDLDTLFNEFAFDPLYFSRQEPKKQVEILQKLAGKEFCDELGALDAKISEEMSERTLVNRELAKMGQLAPVEKIEPIDSGAISSELSKARSHNAAQDSAAYKRQMADVKVAHSLRAVEELGDRLAFAKIEFRKAELELDALPEPAEKIDTSELEAQLSEAGRRAEQASAYKAYKTKLKERTEAQKRSNVMDKTIADLRDSRERIAKSIKLPVEGVTFSDDGIRVGGIPFCQLCSGEQHIVSAQIGCSINSELKIMMIKDGSLLDIDSFRKIAAVAEEREVQLWVESVHGHSDEAIELSGGEIVDDELIF